MTVLFAGWRRASGAEGLGHSGGSLHRLRGVRGLHHGGHGAAPGEDHVRRGRPQRHAEACMSVLWGPSHLHVPCTQLWGQHQLPCSFALFLPSASLLHLPSPSLSQEGNGQIQMGIGELAFLGSGHSLASFRALFTRALWFGVSFPSSQYL